MKKFGVYAGWHRHRREQGGQQGDMVDQHEVMQRPGVGDDDAKRQRPSRRKSSRSRSRSARV